MEAAEFSTYRYIQRNVEIEIKRVDKGGGFIGTLWLNKGWDAAVALVQKGFATVHPYSADLLSWSRRLYAAEVCLVSRLGISPRFGSSLTGTGDPCGFFLGGGEEIEHLGSRE